jgi:hypothetical protein
MPSRFVATAIPFASRELEILTPGVLRERLPEPFIQIVKKNLRG